ncbi:MAG: hypothetical protein GY749_21480 [Desulfobacteraceae bacterium]|nr:hypothetical protein [Desulfobacteraceae bacterium]
MQVKNRKSGKDGTIIAMSITGSKILVQYPKGNKVWGLEANFDEMVCSECGVEHGKEYGPTEWNGPDHYREKYYIGSDGLCKFCRVDKQAAMREFRDNPNIGKDFEDVATPEQILKIQYFSDQHAGPPRWDITDADKVIIGRIALEIGEILRPEQISFVVAYTAIDLVRDKLNHILKHPVPPPQIDALESIKAGMIVYHGENYSIQ